MENVKLKRLVDAIYELDVRTIKASWLADADRVAYEQARERARGIVRAMSVDEVMDLVRLLRFLTAYHDAQRENVDGGGVLDSGA